MATDRDYSAFLVRWQSADDRTPWRSTVENAYTGEKVHFADKIELLRFFWESLNEPDTRDGKEKEA
jgi:hypothetical protein